MELLVVITIIVVLLALLAPAMDDAVQEAVRIRCLTNLKAVGFGLGLYLQDSRQRMPVAPGWHQMFGARGTAVATDVTARPLNRYLGYTHNGTDVPVARCPGDLGDFGSNAVAAAAPTVRTGWNQQSAYTVYGLSYEIAYSNWSGIKGVFIAPTPRATSLSPVHIKILAGDVVMYGNRPYSNPRNNWHVSVPDNPDPARAIRRHNVLMADLRAEFFEFDNADIDEAVDPTNAFQPPFPSRGWW